MSESRKKKVTDLSSGATSLQLYRRLISYALVYWGIFIFAVIGCWCLNRISCLDAADDGWQLRRA